VVCQESGIHAIATLHRLACAFRNA
jgi:hypothetical protein